MSKMINILRYVSVGAVLLAGSCAAPFNDGSALSNDGTVNHPITVAPQTVDLKLSFSAPDAGLLPDDAARLSDFVADYLQHGNGSLSVSVPAGGDSAAAISYFGERLASMGVPRSHILVGTHEVTNGDSRVDVDYIAYIAHTAPCGDWSKSLAYTASNQSSPNFGCAVQQNLAAMVADPRDLLQPRTMDAGDASRRTTVLTNYEKGKVTSADKTADQSTKVSDVGAQ
ncbi:MAG: CpaD family pilus assembly protein [Alphaproteobacteria bacterium]|nr:CpaD family pilus assembly lipoprotein [Alphaproteobacteria bacterium]MDE2112956.1 CpaD family pilus assembly protein [Alphaproteobacteria bacterium]